MKPTMRDMMWAPVTLNGATRCECGERKSTSARCCHRCAYLDGWTETQAHVIDSLRGMDGLSVREICEAVFGRHDANSARSAIRTLQILMKSGRIRRYWYEGKRGTQRHRAGLDITIHEAAMGCWMYVLDGDFRARATGRRH
jgi:hypothetical protein